MKIFIRAIKKYLQHYYTKRLVKSKKRSEIKKFKDERRVAIYSQVVLTADQKKSIDELYVQNYGEKIPYTWHRHFTAYTGEFDEKYFPELLYIPEFEYYMNYNREFAEVFSDKNMLPLLASAIGVKMPSTLLSCTRGVYRDREYRFLSHDQAKAALDNVGEAFVKPSIDSSSGRGCFVIDMRDGVDSISNKTSEEILDALGRDFCVQTRLVNHSSIKALHANSINTFRIITYRWKDEICAMPVIMRIGKGNSFLDNAHAGGMFIALDDDGTMHKTAFTEFNQQYTVHPDSGIVFDGYKIDMLPKVVSKAKVMHEAIPQLGVVNWDFAIDDLGEPVLIEANMLGGSVWLIEMAHGVGAFGEKTEEVLRWLHFIKKIPTKDISKYLFGATN